MKTKATSAKNRGNKKWSAAVTDHSNALDLEKDIFKSGNANQIASSLKQSAEKSKRKKGTPYQSAMSMLNFFINRAGKNLPNKRKLTLERAKSKLRKLFGRDKSSDKKASSTK
ncbi:MAG: hypothetical protein C5B59_18270 [Bacteroidetes bacterium]|nr:MAG: hypothetical protein C5B59_18270 [Bacteroidota bacterium]